MLRRILPEELARHIFDNVFKKRGGKTSIMLHISGTLSKQLKQVCKGDYSIAVWKVWWLEVNIDGAPRRNTEISCWSFCVRDEKEDKLQAQAKAMKNPLITNTQAQTISILQTLGYIYEEETDG